MRRLVRPGAVAAALIALVWAGSSPAWAGTLEGTATYRERIALPPDAVFEAVLQDVSRVDASATVLGRATIDPAGQPPFRFQITYDDAAVQLRRRYVVRATVRHQGREPHLILAHDQPRVTGSGGCNRLIGRFELDGDALRLRGMAGTMMACPAGMEQERRFLDALGKVERYRIAGSHLEMLDATGTVLARFESVAMR